MGERWIPGPRNLATAFTLQLEGKEHPLVVRSRRAGLEGIAERKWD